MDRGKTKAPQKCGAYTKTQNIDMKAITGQETYFSIF